MPYIYHCLLVIFNKNISTLHHFRVVATFAVCVTASDLEKSLSFDMPIEITGHKLFPIHV